MARIVATAHRTNRLPREVYEDFTDNRWDYLLLWAYENFIAEEERKASEKSKSGNSISSTPPRGLGR